MSKMFGVLSRKSMAGSILSRRENFEVLPRYQRKNYIPTFESKQLKIQHGKAVLVSKRKSRRYDSEEYSPTKGHPVLHCYLSDIGFEAMLKDPQGLGADLLNTLLAMYTNQYAHITNKVMQIIPEDTGKLRRSLMRSLTKGKNVIMDEGEVFMEFSTKLPYAVYVNEMPTYPIGVTKKTIGNKNRPSGAGPHVRHPPYVGKYKVGRGGTRLHDPLALGNFMKWIVVKAQNYAPYAISSAIKVLFRAKRTQHGWNYYSQARRYFKFKNRGY